MGAWWATAFGRESVRIASLLGAICTIAVGVVGIASPDLLTAVRRQYFATPLELYSAGAPRRDGGHRDLGRPGVSRAKNAAGVGSRDVPASTHGGTR
jgi:hypothetical protein